MADHNLNVSGSGGSKFRIIGVVLGIIVVVVGGLIWLKQSQKASGLAGSTQLAGTPNVVSLPGVGHASRQYVADVLQSNQDEVEKAKRTGSSAMPTLTRSSAVFHGTYTNPNDGKGNPACSPEALERARKAGVSVSELRCQGCSASELLAAGYTPGELRAAGFSAKQLLAAGLTPAQLRTAGFDAKQLLAAGVSPSQLMSAGFSPKQLLVAGVSAATLKAAGATAAQLAAAGVPLSELKKLGYSAQALAGIKNICSPAKLAIDVKNGVSAMKLKEEGCGAAALKAAGYTAAQLKSAGFDPAQLLKAGFTPAALEKAGFSAKALRAAGVTAAQLLKAGYSPAQLEAAGFTRGALIRAGVSPNELDGDNTKTGHTVDLDKRLAVCSPKTLKEAKSHGVSASVLKKQGCSATELMHAGYTDKQLASAGFTAQQIAALNTVKPKKVVKADTHGFVPDDTVPNLVTSSNPELAALQKRQEAMLAQEQRKQAEQMLQQGMITQAQSLISAWTPPPKQTLIAGMPMKTALSSLTGKGNGGDGQDSSKAPIAKAGSITFGVLDTSINSDYKGTPILATIVQGPLRGGRLLGVFKLQENRVMLSFTTLSMPDYNKSIPVNMLAIDPETARTVLASHVDNHYLLRYGTLFASSFLSGIASAITTSGSSTTTSATAGTTTSFPKLGTRDKLLVALGSVGTAFSTEVAKWVNTPPTVTLNSGTGLGLLFMSDLVMPSPSA